MKKTVSLSLVVLMLLCVFTGCAQKMETVEWETAVDERIVETIGGPRADAVKALGLTDEDLVDGQSSFYSAELTWCGMPMETEIGFWEDVFNAAIGKATFTYDESISELIPRCLAMLEEQFNAPYKYMTIDGNSAMGTDVIPDPDEALTALEETDDGGIGYRYSVSGENGGTGDEGPYVDVMFMRYKEEPGMIRITFSVNNLERTQ